MKISGNLNLADQVGHSHDVQTHIYRTVSKNINDKLGRMLATDF